MAKPNLPRPDWQVRAEEKAARQHRRESVYRLGLILLALGVAIVVYQALGLVYR